MVDAKIFGNEEIKLHSQVNNFGIDKNKKKKNSKIFISLKNSDVLDKYKKEFQQDIKLTINAINKLEIKNAFYTPDANYEEININENFHNKNNFITTRNRNNILNNISNLNFTRISTSDRTKSFPFDFHIKNADDNTYEKIVID